jgi:phosphatidylserine/phosphatidylglycerophosphate/cardiolipin synthase-like enzyme
MKRKKRRLRPFWAALMLTPLLAAAAFVTTHFIAGGDAAGLPGAAWRSISHTAGWPERAVRFLPRYEVPSEEGEIQVFFAPVHPMHPNGIDDRLIRLIRGASRSVDAAFYDLQLDKAAEALIDRHQAGVKVRLVSDSHYQDRDAMQRCIRAGIPVIFDRRSAFMHNKFCVIDGLQVWTGSTNITENGLYRNDNNAILIASSKLAGNFILEFEEMFLDRRFGARSPQNTPYPELKLANTRIECYFAPEDGVRDRIIATIATARQGVDFMAFVFTCQAIADAMADRVSSGVRVRGLFEARNVNSRHSRDDFLRERGVEVFLDKNPYNMHNKVVIVDGRTVITGSYNFSRNAETQNDENVLILHDPGLAAHYTDRFEALLP